MRISTRFSLVLLGLGACIFGTFGVIYYKKESRDLRNVARRNTLLLGRSLQVASENAVRDGQVSDIREVVGKIDRVDPTIRVLIANRLGELIVDSHESTTPSALLLRLLTRSVSIDGPIVRSRHIDGVDVYIFMAPFFDDEEERIGGIVMVRPLHDVAADLSSSRMSIAITVLAFALATTFAGFLMGRRFLIRPMRGLVSTVRDMREGRVSIPDVPKRVDEVGELTLEFARLAADLSDVRQQLAEAANAQRDVERRLHRADKLITVGQLSAGLAHEIGSPLQVLSNRARFLHGHANDPDQVRRVSAIIVEQIDRIRRIVEQLLQVSRRRTPVLELADLEQIVNRIIVLLGHEARRRQVKLSACAQPGLPAVAVDEDQIQQMVLNLVMNALEATDAGGEVRVELARSVVKMARMKQETRCVRIEVSDSGCGMDTETASRLFEPFFTTNAQGIGTGLGLTVVQSIVTAHGGRIDLKTAPGRGSRFIVDLPLDAGFHHGIETYRFGDDTSRRSDIA